MYKTYNELYEAMLENSRQKLTKVHTDGNKTSLFNKRI